MVALDFSVAADSHRSGDSHRRSADIHRRSADIYRRSDDTDGSRSRTLRRGLYKICYPQFSVCLHHLWKVIP